MVSNAPMACLSWMVIIVSVLLEIRQLFGRVEDARDTSGKGAFLENVGIGEEPGCSREVALSLLPSRDTSQNPASFGKDSLTRFTIDILQKLGL